MTSAAMLQSLISFADEMDREYQSIVLDPENAPEVLSILAVAVRDLRQDLAELGRTIEADLIASAGAKRFIVENLGEVQIRKVTKRNEWDNPSLWRRVAALALDERQLDEATGEYEPREQAVARVLELCARPSWRVTALRDHGVDPDEYCHTEDGGWQVQLPSRG